MSKCSASEILLYIFTLMALYAQHAGDIDTARSPYIDNAQDIYAQYDDPTGNQIDLYR